jgi:plastocyanin
MGCFASDSAPVVARPAAVSVTIATAPGQVLAFVPAEITIQGGGPVAVAFRNRSSVAHNLVFTGTPTVATRTIVEPGGADEIVLDSTEPGRLAFVCTIHDGMAGVLVIESPGP